MKINLYKLTGIISLTMLLATAVGCGSDASATVHNTPAVMNEASNNVYTRSETVTTFEEAKKLLVEGNQRYISGNVLNDDLSNTKREELVSKGQHPFATIVSCSDSRVPPEIIFDQALGDIFVIRNAGNVIDPVTLGSIEYGAEHLHTPVIVVLGHENCGAVKATVDGGGKAEGNIENIVEKINKSLEKVKSSGVSGDKLYGECENENIDNSINEIKNSAVIKELEEEKKVVVVGAKYDINTGEVTFSPVE